MKKNIRSKISGFLTSEEGRVSTAGGLLLAHAIVGTPQAEARSCVSDADCRVGQSCDNGTCKSS